MATANEDEEASRPPSQLTNMAVLSQLKGHPGVTQWRLFGAALLLTGSAIGWNLYAERNAVDVRERERLGTQAKVIAENLGRQLQATNSALESIRADLPFLLKDSKDGKSQINRRLQAMCDAMAGVRTIVIMDADGQSTASNRGELIGQDFWEAERFQLVRRAGNPTALHVSPPFRTPLGVYAIGVAKMVVGDRGEFARGTFAICRVATRASFWRSRCVGCGARIAGK